MSYVLNDNRTESIPESTRNAVTEAARRLNYRPNLAARNLKSGGNQLVVLAVGNMAFPGLQHAVTRLTGDLADRGVALIVHFERDDGIDLLGLAQRLDPSAVISIAPLSLAIQDELRRGGINVVNAFESTDDLAAVFPDVGALQAAHLIEGGHTRIGFAHPTESGLAALAASRLRGAADECARNGLDSPALQFLSPDGEDAEAAVREWASRGVTAVVAYNDDVAFRVLHGIRIAGLACPSDLAVIGVDNIPLSGISAPPLTTYAWDERAANWSLSHRLLVALGRPADGDRPEGPVMELHVRRSV